MQQVLRPYATAGIALVGASIIAVTPTLAPPPLRVQARPVQLVDAWSDLISNTVTNLDSIASNANLSDISQVFSALLTNPFGVIGAFTNLDPTVTADLGSLPATIDVQMPPGLELGISGLGAWGALATAINNVLPSVESNPANLFEGIATVLNGYLNGVDNISLLDGAITIPAWNGILAPETSLDFNLNLTSLIDALGLGNTPLTDLDLSSLLSQIGLGDLTLGSLFSDLGLSDQGLGNLLADATNPVTSLSGLLNLLGLTNLGSGDGITLGLTNILQGLGLDTNVDLNSLSLSSILSAFGIDPTQILSPSNLLSVLGINTGDQVNLDSLLGALGLDTGNAVSLTDLLNAAGITGNLVTPDDLLTALGISGLGTDVTSSTLLTALGLSSTTPVSLTDLLGAAGLGSTTVPVTSLLSALGLDSGNTVNADTLLNAIGIGSADTLPTGSTLTLLTDALDGVLSAFGIDPSATGVGTAVSTLLTTLTTILGLPISTPDSIGGLLTSLLSSLGITAGTPTLGTVLGDLGLTGSPSLSLETLLVNDLGLSSSANLGSLLDLILPSTTPTLGELLSSLGLTGSNVTVGDLLSALGQSSGGLTIGGLLGDLGLTKSLTVGGLLSDLGLSGTGLSLGNLLSDLGIAPGSGLTIGGVLEALGFSSSTGDLTLGGLLSDLGNPFGALNITDLLNGLNLGDLLNDLSLNGLNLSDLPLNLSDLGDLSNLNLGDLLGDLGLGDLANISVEPMGGYVTLLADVVPQQILAALGM
jgi:hypothetical protein